MFKRLAAAVQQIAINLLLVVCALLFLHSGQAFASGIEITGDDVGLNVEGNSPLFNVSNMAPGSLAEASLTVRNTGRHDFSFTLTAEKEDGDDLFFEGLNIKVTGKNGTSYYNGPLSELSGIEISGLSKGDYEELTLAISLPPGSGNAIQGSQVAVKFILDAEQRRQYSISAAADPPEGGTVDGGGTYDHGAAVTLTAAANPGYAFVYFLENNELYSILEPGYTFTALDDRSLAARFWKVEPHTEIKRVVFNESGTGYASFDGMKMTIYGEPGAVGLIAATRCQESRGRIPAGWKAANLCWSIQRSENLAGTTARLEFSYAGESLPAGVSPSNLKLFRYNEARDRWELAGIKEQGVNTAGQHVWAVLENFSLFGLFYPGAAVLPKTNSYLYWLLPPGLAAAAMGCFLLQRRRSKPGSSRG